MNFSLLILLFASRGENILPQGSVGLLRHGICHFATFPQGLSEKDSWRSDQPLLFLARWGQSFGFPPGAQLEELGERRDELGMTHVRFRQWHEDFPIFPSDFRLHWNSSGSLIAAQGRGFQHFAPLPERKSNPADLRELVQGWAAAYVARPELDEGEIWWYVRAATWGQEDVARLCCRFTERSSGDQYWVSLEDGKAYDRLPGRHDLQRRVYSGGFESAKLVWQEGQALPFSGSDEALINQLIQSTGHTYNLFAGLSGGSQNGFNGADGTMNCVLRPPELDSVNAFWNGSYTGFSPELVMDDVVAHEWTHAYTQYSHALIYRWQSGALNEAYSDIFGEAVDVFDGGGLDQPSPHRSDGAYSAYTVPRMELLVQASGWSGPMVVGQASFGAALDELGVRGRLVSYLASGENPQEACAAALQPEQLRGSVALVDRGTCTFVQKAQNAQAAGAIALVVINVSSNAPVSMGGDGGGVTIPLLSVGNGDGLRLRQFLAQGPVEVHLRSDPQTREDSVRWLMGEERGQALRDMWAPHARNHPERVTDPLYLCGPADEANDQGGVHTNSAVPNHAFALLVDGGSSGGIQVPAIGWTRALAIYLRAMEHYQTPTSDFAIHAAALRQAATDLLGQALMPPTTAGPPWSPAAELIAPVHLAALDEALRATAMEEEPSHCGFATILSAASPSPCPGTVPSTLFADDFSQGIAAWRLSNQGVKAVFTPRNWRLVNQAPNRSGSFLFATNSKTYGTCQPGGDQSGRLMAESPLIAVSEDPASAPLHLLFEHNVALESDRDGGLVALSVNEGPLQILPPERFLLNPYNRILADGAAGNGNPFAGYPAFSGKDGGSNASQWGISQVDLSSYLRAGDRFRVVFLLGVDACGGEDGWYVDWVRLRACSPQAASHVASSRFIPHITRSGGGFSTRLILQNQADSPQSIALQPISAQGTPLPPVHLDVPARATREGNVGTWFPELELGSLTLAGSESVVVSAAYRIASGEGASAHVAESTQSGTVFRIFPAEPEFVFDGVAFVNAGEVSALVEAQALDETGAELARILLYSALEPFAKGLATFDALQAPGVASIRLLADQPLHATFLRGTRVGVSPGYLYAITPLLE